MFEDYKHRRCNANDTRHEIIIKFEKLEIDVNVNVKIVPPEPVTPTPVLSFKFGPVSNK